MTQGRFAAACSLLALLATGMATAQDRSREFKFVELAAGPQLSEQERLLRDIITTNVEPEEWVRSRLDLGPEFYLKAYHDSILDIAKANGGTITDRNKQQSAIRSSQLKASALDSRSLYHRTTQKYDDLVAIARLLTMLKLPLDPLQNSSCQSKYYYNMSRLSAFSVHAFFESLDHSADLDRSYVLQTAQGNYKVVSPKLMTSAIEIAIRAARAIGDEQANSHKGFDYLQLGETEKFLHQAFNSNNTPNMETVPGLGMKMVQGQGWRSC